jgi:hypothetical protein
MGIISSTPSAQPPHGLPTGSIVYGGFGKNKKPWYASAPGKNFKMPKNATFRYDPMPSINTYDKTRASRALKDGTYLTQQAQINDTYRQGANERGLRTQTYDIDYNDAKRRLAEKSITDRAQLDARAAKSGVLFSQGRMNAQNNYSRVVNDQLASSQANYNKGMFQIGAEELAAKSLRDNSNKGNLSLAVDRTLANDRANLKAITPRYYAPTAQYQYLGKRGNDYIPYRLGKGGKKIYMDDDGKKLIPQTNLLK